MTSNEPTFEFDTQSGLVKLTPDLCKALAAVLRRLIPDAADYRITGIELRITATKRPLSRCYTRHKTAPPKPAASAPES